VSKARYLLLVLVAMMAACEPGESPVAPLDSSLDLEAGAALAPTQSAVGFGNGTMMNSSTLLNWDSAGTINYSANGKSYELRHDTTSNGYTAGIEVYENGAFWGRMVPIYSTDMSSVTAYEWHSPDTSQDWIISDGTGAPDVWSPSIEDMGLECDELSDPSGTDCCPAGVDEPSGGDDGPGDGCGLEMLQATTLEAVFFMDGTVAYSSTGDGPDAACVAARDNFETELLQTAGSGITFILSGVVALTVHSVAPVPGGNPVSKKAAGISIAALVAFGDSVVDSIKDYRTMKAACED